MDLPKTALGLLRPEENIFIGPSLKQGPKSLTLTFAASMFL